MTPRLGEGGQHGDLDDAVRVRAPQENVNAARVMYAAVLTFGSDGFTPIVGAFQGQ